MAEIIDFFSSYDIQKSHGRSIDRDKALELGLPIVLPESIEGLSELIRSLHNQFEMFLDQTPFFKLYENARGITWGRQARQLTVELPMPGPGARGPVQDPGVPHPSG